MKDLKRLNVALTRAKKKLILIGTEGYLKEIKPLDKILEKMQAEGWEQELERTAEEMRDRLANKVDLIIDGGNCGFEPTTVVNMEDSSYEILRQGKGEFNLP